MITFTNTAMIFKNFECMCTRTDFKLSLLSLIITTKVHEMQDSCQVPEQFNKAFFTSLVIESKLDRTLFAAIIKIEFLRVLF